MEAVIIYAENLSDNCTMAVSSRAHIFRHALVSENREDQQVRGREYISGVLAP